MCPSHAAPLDISRVPHRLLKSSITQSNCGIFCWSGFFFPLSLFFFITSISNTDPLPEQFKMHRIFTSSQLCSSLSGSKFRLTVRPLKLSLSSTFEKQLIYEPKLSVVELDL